MEHTRCHASINCLWASPEVCPAQKYSRMKIHKYKYKYSSSHDNTSINCLWTTGSMSNRKIPQQYKFTNIPPIDWDSQFEKDTFLPKSLLNMDLDCPESVHAKQSNILSSWQIELVLWLHYIWNVRTWFSPEIFLWSLISFWACHGGNHYWSPAVFGGSIARLHVWHWRSLWEFTLYPPSACISTLYSYCKYFLVLRNCCISPWPAYFFVWGRPGGG